MKVNDTLANTIRAAHDVGPAGVAWRFEVRQLAMNPSLEKIASRPERGEVLNAAWNGYNPVNALGLGVAAVGWAAARITEAENDELTGVEQQLSWPKDVLMGAAVLSGAVDGLLGARLAKQAPDGAVPIESSTEPAEAVTPQSAAKIPRAIGLFGNLNVAVGVTLDAVNLLPPRPAVPSARPARSARCGPAPR